MPKFVIEREIPGAGKLTPEQLNIVMNGYGRQFDGQRNAIDALVRAERRSTDDGNLRRLAS